MLAAVPLVKLGVTVKVLDTVLVSVTVKVIVLPSVALASFTVTFARSSSQMMPLPPAFAFRTPLGASVKANQIVKGSPFASTLSSSMVVTVTVLVSPAVPAKVSTVASPV